MLLWILVARLAVGVCFVDFFLLSASLWVARCWALHMLLSLGVGMGHECSAVALWGFSACGMHTPYPLSSVHNIRPLLEGSPTPQGGGSVACGWVG